MADEITAVDLSSPQGRFDAACIYLAACAFPRDSLRRRNQAIRAMRSIYFREAKAHGLRVRTAASRAALQMSNREASRLISTLEKRLNRRIEALSRVGGILIFAKVRDGDGRVRSLNHIQRTRRIGPRVFDTWRPEVFHLSLALVRALESLGDLGVLGLIARADDWIVSAIRRAETLQKFRYASNLPPALCGSPTSTGFQRASLVRIVDRDTWSK